MPRGRPHNPHPELSAGLDAREHRHPHHWMILCPACGTGMLFKRFYSSKQAAYVLSVPVGDIARLVRSGKLKARYRILNERIQRVFDYFDIDDYIRTQSIYVTEAQADSENELGRLVAKRLDRSRYGPRRRRVGWKKKERP